VTVLFFGIFEEAFPGFFPDAGISKPEIIAM
jgi:hypothetical protein